MKTAFIQKARKTAHLTELIERYRRWRVSRGIEDTDSDNDDDMLVRLRSVNLSVVFFQCLGSEERRPTSKKTRQLIVVENHKKNAAGSIDRVCPVRAPGL